MKPKKHVFVCTQGRPPGHPRGSCMQGGGQAVMQAFLNELTNRNAFGRFAVTACGCLGPCDGGPHVLVYPEGVMYQQVQPGNVGDIFDQHLEFDEPVERLRVPPGVWD